jgi:16S rRNA (guanine527-N7)-methyltransferase
LLVELRRWQTIKNLVGPATLTEAWTRHIADSAQLLPLAPERGLWLDLGAGGGFPGLVLAILRTEQALGPTVLLESNGRKCAFLRHMLGALRLDGHVLEGRLETLLPRVAEPVAVVSARALAPLADLLAWTNPLLRKGAVAIFPKGQEVETEMREAAAGEAFSIERWPSLTDARACILRIRSADLERRD